MQSFVDSENGCNTVYILGQIPNETNLKINSIQKQCIIKERKYIQLQGFKPVQTVNNRNRGKQNQNRDLTKLETGRYYNTKPKPKKLILVLKFKPESLI